jgi:hypothetical protein
VMPTVVDDDGDLSLIDEVELAPAAQCAENEVVDDEADEAAEAAEADEAAAAAAPDAAARRKLLQAGRRSRQPGARSRNIRVSGGSRGQIGYGRPSATRGRSGRRG